MTQEELKQKIDAALAAYDGLDPYQRAAHNYEQRKSWIRGMCPSNRNYAEWCKLVDRVMLPPLGLKRD